MNDAASFGAIMQCNLLEVFCEAIGAAVFVTDKLDQLNFASVRLLQFFPVTEAAIEPGQRARDLYGAMFDAGCRFGHATGDRDKVRGREEWIAERVAAAWKERVDTIEQIGPDRWIRIVSRRFSSGLGFTVMQDVSEQKKKEVQWRAEQERVKLTEEILDSLPVAIAVKDRNLNFAAVNQEFCRILKITPDAILGRSVWDIVEPELAARMEESDWQLLATGEDRETKINLGHVDGEALNILHRAKRVGRSGQHYLSMSFVELNAEGGLQGWAQSNADISPLDATLSPATAPVTPPKRMLKVAYLLADWREDAAIRSLAADHGIELCIINSESELSAFLPAARNAGLAIDLVLIDGRSSPSAYNIAAAAGVNFRLVSAGVHSAALIPEILKFMDSISPLPALEPAPPCQAARTRRPQPDAQQTGIKNARAIDILAIEDNPVNRMAMEQIFESLGIQFVIAHSGQDALARIALVDPRVILADLTLPDMDSTMLVSALQARLGESSKWPPIIGLMAADTEANRMQCQEAGFQGAIAKPLSPDGLDALMRKHYFGWTDAETDHSKNAA